MYGLEKMQYLLYVYPRIAVTKFHKRGGLEHQKFIFSCVWRLEVQTQGVSKNWRRIFCIFQLLEATDLPLLAVCVS